MRESLASDLWCWFLSTTCVKEPIKYKDIEYGWPIGTIQFWLFYCSSFYQGYRANQTQEKQRGIWSLISMLHNNYEFFMKSDKFMGAISIKNNWFWLLSSYISLIKSSIFLITLSFSKFIWRIQLFPLMWVNPLFSSWEQYKNTVIPHYRNNSPY